MAKQQQMQMVIMNLYLKPYQTKKLINLAYQFSVIKSQQTSQILMAKLEAPQQL